MQRNSPDQYTPSPHALFPQEEPVRRHHLLLVSEDPRWIVPVREAAAAEGGLVETVNTREAVARLAGVDRGYSHVLLDRNNEAALVSMIAALTSDIASARTTLLFLGRSRTFLPWEGRPAHQAGVIQTASRAAIAAALRAARYAPPPHNTPRLPPAELWEVVNGGMIETRYQPIVRLADRKPVTVEALARLNHPIHGILTPDWFVPRFEDQGLASTLTDLVSTLVLADQKGIDLAVALNYPLDVLSHHAAAEGLDQKREVWGIPADRIVIELTESRPVEDFAALGRSLEKLRTLGYRISIDDVGPAVKNLDRLLTLPFTGLKLDKGIVTMVGTDGPDAQSAPRAIEQAHAHGLSIVAEGVETQEMWDRLLALGVQEAQGYFVARPLPAAAVPVWRRAWNGEG